jgi:hypothetical protein
VLEYRSGWQGWRRCESGFRPVAGHGGGGEEGVGWIGIVCADEASSSEKLAFAELVGYILVLFG